MRYFLILILFLLTACPASPVVVNIENGNEQTLTCPELAKEIQNAQIAKKDARKEDRFRLRYMMPTNAMISIYNMNRAEGHAEKRLELLNKIYKSKNCDNPYYNQYNNTMNGGGYYYQNNAPYNGGVIMNNNQMQMPQNNQMPVMQNPSVQGGSEQDINDMNQYLTPYDVDHGYPEYVTPKKNLKHFIFN